jgi:hypothetical protein
MALCESKAADAGACRASGFLWLSAAKARARKDLLIDAKLYVFPQSSDLKIDAGNQVR